VESTFIQPPVVSGFELLARSLAAFFNRHHVTVTTIWTWWFDGFSCASLYLPSSDECALKRVLTVNVIYSLGKKDYILSSNLLSRALESISLCYSYSSIINLLQIYVLLLYFQNDFTSWKLILLRSGPFGGPRVVACWLRGDIRHSEDFSDGVTWVWLAQNLKLICYSSIPLLYQLRGGGGWGILERSAQTYSIFSSFPNIWATFC
jgi:hypothetical protein